MKELKFEELQEINGGRRKKGLVYNIGSKIGMMGGTAYRTIKSFGKAIPGPMPPFFIIPKSPFNNVA